MDERSEGRRLVSGCRIVVGVDGSLPAQQALRWAVALGDGLGLAIVAVHAVGPLDRWPDPDAPVRPWRQALSDLVERTWCAPLAGVATPHRVDVREGPAVEVLLAATAAERATLLVVGTRGRGTDPARALGSTSLQVLQSAQVPVLVVPAAGRGWGRPGPVVAPRLLAAVDGSPPSLAALAMAADIAGLLGGSLKVLHVFGPRGGHALDRTLTRVEAELRGIRALGLRAPTIVRSGDPAATILDVAGDVDADVVVVGSGSHGGQVELLPDSVARTVAGRAERPTLVVPAAGRPRWPPCPPAATAAASTLRTAPV